MSLETEGQEDFVTIQQEVELTPLQRVMTLIAESVDSGHGRTLDADQLKTLFDGYVFMARELSTPAVEAEPVNKKKWRL